jgi:class 3 adenylate cyclase
MERDVKYCTTDDGVRIAYCVEGNGPTTILALPAVFESFSLDHLMPVYRQFYRDLGEGRRIVRLDWRATGLSGGAAQVDTSADSRYLDVSAVARAAGSGKYTIWSSSSSGPWAIRYTARHPDMVSHLILYGTYAATRDALSETLRRGLRNLADVDWEMAMQTVADMNGRREFPHEGAQLGEWFSRSAQRWPAGGTTDSGDMLPEISVPTLVLHRITDPAVPLSAGQRLAAEIPGARLVPLEGKGHLFCLGDYSAILSAVDDFLGDKPVASSGATSVAASGTMSSGMTAILFADIADSTALTERLGDAAFRAKARELDGALRTIIRENAGTPIEGKLLGDGVLAVFTSAREAIEAALRGEQGRHAGLPLHLGIHAGDVIRERDPDGRDNVYGGAVNIASRIAGLSAASEVLVSETVRSLARTSAGVLFEDRGEQSLKGVGEAVRVWAVVAEPRTENPEPQGA